MTPMAHGEGLGSNHAHLGSLLLITSPYTMLKATHLRLTNIETESCAFVRKRFIRFFPEILTCDYLLHYLLWGNVMRGIQPVTFPAYAQNLGSE